MMILTKSLLIDHTLNEVSMDKAALAYQTLVVGAEQ
jgi:hypothetical protein